MCSGEGLFSFHCCNVHKQLFPFFLLFRPDLEPAEITGVFPAFLECHIINERFLLCLVFVFFFFEGYSLYLEFSCVMVNVKSKFHELIDSYFSRIVFSNYGKAKYKAFFHPLGTLEDWDAAVQKTENRLARVNEQRTKVRTL